MRHVSTGTRPRKGTRRKPTKPSKRVLHEIWLQEHGQEYQERLLQNIKKRLPELEALAKHVEDHWPRQRINPFDPRGFKVYYRLQPKTQKMVTILQELLPDRPLRRHFCRLVAEGTGHESDQSKNPRWTKLAQPIFKAYYTAYACLKMACEAGRATMPSQGPPPDWWVGLLYLFDLS
jgi:hypothetical protein